MSRVLLADDDPFFRNAVAAVLGRHGFEVILATDGVDLFRQLETAQPDLIVTDIFMPDMDGIEILRALNKCQNRIPVIAISGGSSSGDFDALRAADMFGAEKVMSKPLDFDAFIATARLLTGTPAAEP